MTLISRAILRTLAYADVFDYPLNEREIYRFLISNLQFPLRRQSFGASATISAKIFRKDGFYFLKNREKIVSIRKKREKWSQKKIKIAKRVAGWLKLIPWIKMVAVTGALAMRNSDKNDDIDLLIISAKNRLWLTRLLTVFLVELVARRRRPGDLPASRQVKDKICLNMFLDEDHLALPKKEQDLFSAHEVCQLKPIWNKNEIYNKFVSQNQWVKKFLANWSA